MKETKQKEMPKEKGLIPNPKSYVDDMFNREQIQYNKGRADMLEWLPTREEIRKILLQTQMNILSKHQVKANLDDYATAIDKRMRG